LQIEQRLNVGHSDPVIQYGMVID